MNSISALDKGQWDRCFAGALETYDYLLAVERSALPGFSWRYVVVEQSGKIVAAAPAFLTTYALDTTLTGWGKRLVMRIRRLAPWALALRLGCIGSPCTETAGIGFGPEVATDEQLTLLARLIAAFQDAALLDGAGLLAIKDAPVARSEPWRYSLTLLGYRALPGMPTAMLDMQFASLDRYLDSLSAGTRKDMRRKMRALSSLKIVRTTDVIDLLPQMYALYLDTLRRADMQFEELTPDYFSQVLALMPERAFCMLYLEGDRLIGFNLLIEAESTLLDKFFCMDGERGRQLNLYFLSWLTNVRYCIVKGLKCYQSGQGAYENKLRLGSRLEPALMFFKHRNLIVSRALQAVAPLFYQNSAFVKVPE